MTKEMGMGVEHALRDKGNGLTNHQFRRRSGPGTEEDADPRDDFLSTAHKLDFPKYDDNNDSLPGVNRCERYFCVRRTPEHKRVATPHSTSWTTPSSSSTD
jgi:hypothetical protein